MDIYNKHRVRIDILRTLHVLVLIGAVSLIVLISYDCFRNISFLASTTYMSIQFWICIFFMIDVIIEFMLSPGRWKYFYIYLFSLLVSIPYLNLIHYYDISLSPELQYLIRFSPMIRAAYVFIIVLGVLSTDRISSLFSAYIGLLVATVYFSSMMFFIEEHYINTGVTTYWSALWWAFMNITTVGCNINEITATGKVLSVVLSAEGLILFPVFTVYLTNALTRKTTQLKQQPDSKVKKSSILQT